MISRFHDVFTAFRTDFVACCRDLIVTGMVHLQKGGQVQDGQVFDFFGNWTRDFTGLLSSALTTSVY